MRIPNRDGVLIASPCPRCGCEETIYVRTGDSMKIKACLWCGNILHAFRWDDVIRSGEPDGKR
jgi:NMD protein affecting ribosome stability and mRNA decay